MSESILQAEHLTFRYFENAKRNILEDLSFEIPGGQITVLLGASGCGKSTLAAVLSGLYPENGGFLASGTIRVDGKDLKGLGYSERSRFVTEMFQNPDLQFCMKNLREELYFCMENQKIPREEMDTLLAQTVKKYHAEDLLERPFTELSGGEKQRAALTCLLMIGPKLMILDEPFANLDEAAAKSYLAILAEAVRKEKRSVLVIDHMPENWLHLADQFVLLDENCRAACPPIPAGELAAHRDDLKRLGLRDPFAEPVRKKGQNALPASAGKTPAVRSADGSDAGASGSTDAGAKTAAAQQIPSIFIRDASVFHKKKKTPVLHDVNLCAYPGEMVACLGPSGSGKTSLFYALLGQKKYTGSISICGKELAKMPKKELFGDIGIVFQNPANQFITTSVEKEIEESLKIWKKESEEKAQEDADRLLEKFDLRHYRRYSPFMLSQGQQRRLGVLTMLAGGQRILLLDEPTYGQDAKTTDAIMEQMTACAAEGITVVFSTHDRKLALACADRVWHVEGGEAYA